MSLDATPSAALAVDEAGGGRQTERRGQRFSTASSQAALCRSTVAPHVLQLLAERLERAFAGAKPRGGSSRGGTKGRGSSRGCSSRGGSSRWGSSRGGSSSGGESRGGSSRKRSSRGRSSREGSSRGVPSRERSSREGYSKEGSDCCGDQDHLESSRHPREYP